MTRRTCHNVRCSDGGTPQRLGATRRRSESVRAKTSAHTDLEVGYNLTKTPAPVPGENLTCRFHTKGQRPGRREITR